MHDKFMTILYKRINFIFILLYYVYKLAESFFFKLIVIIVQYAMKTAVRSL